MKSKKRTIITLCGSTRHKAVFEAVCKELTLAGNLVLNLGCFGHMDPDPRISNNRKLLRDLQRMRICLSDEIMVIDIGKIGKSTKEEIKFALKSGKRIRYLSQHNIIKYAIIHYYCTKCFHSWTEFARPSMPKCPKCDSIYVDEQNAGPPPEFDDGSVCDACPNKEGCKLPFPSEGCWGDDSQLLDLRDAEPPNHP